LRRAQSAPPGRVGSPRPGYVKHNVGAGYDRTAGSVPPRPRCVWAGIDGPGSPRKRTGPAGRLPGPESQARSLGVQTLEQAGRSCRISPASCERQRSTGCCPGRAGIAIFARPLMPTDLVRTTAEAGLPSCPDRTWCFDHQPPREETGRGRLTPPSSAMQNAPLEARHRIAHPGVAATREAESFPSGLGDEHGGDCRPITSWSGLRDGGSTRLRFIRGRLNGGCWRRGPGRTAHGSCRRARGDVGVPGGRLVPSSRPSRRLRVHLRVPGRDPPVNGLTTPKLGPRPGGRHSRQRTARRWRSYQQEVGPCTRSSRTSPVSSSNGDWCRNSSRTSRPGPVEPALPGRLRPRYRARGCAELEYAPPSHCFQDGCRRASGSSVPPLIPAKRRLRRAATILNSVRAPSPQYCWTGARGLGRSSRRGLSCSAPCGQWHCSQGRAERYLP